MYRIDANALAHNRGYQSVYFVQGYALTTLKVLADLLEGNMQVDTALVKDVQQAHAQAVDLVNATLGQYAKLKNALSEQVGADFWWVRDITLSNSMWGNRAPALNRARKSQLGGVTHE